MRTCAQFRSGIYWQRGGGGGGVSVISGG